LSSSIWNIGILNPIERRPMKELAEVEISR
jgi:hypothetical protein